MRKKKDIRIKFTKKYKHIGYSYLSIPDGWLDETIKALIKIEKIMWPTYLPMFMKRMIHELATGNSVVRVKYKWAHDLRNIFTDGIMIHDIKEKFGGIRIYGGFNDEIYKIIEELEERLDKTCQECGKYSEDVGSVKRGGWYSTECSECENNN
jgi:hypothetical protein